MPDSPSPSLDAIRADLAFFTRRWPELAAPARIELRALGEGSSPQSGFFAATALDEAAEWAASLNARGRNLYMCRNPLRGDLAKPAADGDAVGAFFVWADCDDAASVAAIRSYGGPGHAATVLTGRVPSLRAHLYWELEEPCLNLDAWREVQRGIAARFGSDLAVINPSRIMRLSGTVSWPNAKKAAKGYVPELVGLRTEFEDDRDPVPFERLRAEFPPGAVRAAAPAEGGAALDRAMATAEIRAGRNWHENVVRLVASYVSRGLGDDEIHAITDGFTTAGYTVADTRREVQTAIDGARRKFKPRPPRRERAPSPAPSGGGDAAEPPSGDRDEVVRACLGQPLNDYGNGQRLRLHFGDDLLFVARMGWFSWDGVRWRQDEDQLLVRGLSHRIAGLIRREAELIGYTPAEREADEEWRAERPLYLELKAKTARERTDEDKAELARLEELRKRAQRGWRRVMSAQEALASFAESSGNSNRLSNMESEAKPYLARPIGDLNADPLLLTCRNATLRLHPPIKGDEPGALIEARVEARGQARGDLVTKLCPVEWKPEAACPLFDAFLARIVPNTAVRAFLKRWFGYTLTGLTGEQKLVFLYGIGKNGKSTLVDILARIMGDYATTVPIETLTGQDARKGAEATPDLVRLPGARMVRASEPEEGVRLKEALIKALTGGEPVLIRRMREEFVEVTPEFKLVISGNHKPNVKGTDDGIWRRLLLVPFLEQIGHNERDPGLPAKLWAERDGIFRWMVEGALDYLDHGLQEPDEVLEATAEFREERDVLGRYLNEACEVTGDAEDRIEAKRLAAGFAFFLRDNGEAVWGDRTIANGLTNKASQDGRPSPWRSAEGRTFTKTKSSLSLYVGLRFRPDFEARFNADEVKGGKR